MFVFLQVSKRNAYDWQKKVIEPHANTVEAIVETLLFRLKPKQYNFSQFLFSAYCNAKHVPKDIRKTQEMKGQRMVKTTTASKMKELRESGAHERNIAHLLWKVIIIIFL